MQRMSIEEVKEGTPGLAVYIESGEATAIESAGRPVAYVYPCGAPEEQDAPPTTTNRAAIVAKIRALQALMPDDISYEEIEKWKNDGR